MDDKAHSVTGPELKEAVRARKGIGKWDKWKIIISFFKSNALKAK
jgi:hypothetical protein